MRDLFAAPPEMTLDKLRGMMLENGATQLLVKPLAPNDNSKNQVYLGEGFETLSILPAGELHAERTDKGSETLKAPLDFLWLQDDGSVASAPGTQLILYPQYPEVRMSGFLKGARRAPSLLMASRRPGRLLFLGITAHRQIIAYVTGAHTALANGFGELEAPERTGVFLKIPLRPDERRTTRQVLLERLYEIHGKGWIRSWGLRADGTTMPCESTQCVGYTLEAELGIARNGYSEPDYLGWEVKAGQVDRYTRTPPGKAMTLMTPEPTGGFYREEGVPSFIRRFGYPDKRGRPDRLNFGGVFREGVRHAATDLTLRLIGYDAGRRLITDPEGCLALVRGDEIAASWSFTSLGSLWNRKHAQAVYVPAECRQPPRQYRYGNIVRLGEGTDFLRLLQAIAEGKVCYDPGIKLEHVSTPRPLVKRRSQFRIRSGDLGCLYRAMETVRIDSDR